jgi:hypothetical protein
MSPSTPIATPTPIPALAPVDSDPDEEDADDEDDEDTPVAVAVGAENEVDVVLESLMIKLLVLEELMTSIGGVVDTTSGMVVGVDVVTGLVGAASEATAAGVVCDRC